ncbi:MAG TPA: YdhR family protein [Geobacteraceae bacterium]|nr:YdhR family protein [Geobacteraceae bacterium]
MITAFVQFRLPKPVTPEQARAIFLGTAPKYQETPGLVRKYYILSQDGRTAGGIYLWKSRGEAERLYSDNWKAFILEKYEALPTVTYFDTPVVVDNVTHQIIADE